MLKNQSLTILQYNVNNFKFKIIIFLFETKNIFDYDVLVIQKSWKNSFQNVINNKLNQYFDTYYMNNFKIKVCFFVNKHITLIFYTKIYWIDDFNIMSLRLLENKIINIHNIYNSCKNNDDENLLKQIKQILNENKNEKYILLNDFNLHHFKWNENHIITNANAYKLIIMIEKYRLKRTLFVDIITWRKNICESTINLTFMTSLLRENAIDAMIVVNMNNCSNHYLIRVKDVD